MRERQLLNCRATALRAAATVAILAGAAPAGAGTGRELSSWMSFAPRLDGSIAAAEWQAAPAIDLGNGVSLRIGNDARTLYLGIVDANNVTLGDGTFVGLWFDDEGGSAPTLDDGNWDNPACQGNPALGEGLLLFESDQTAAFGEYVAQGTGCSAQSATAGLRVRVAAPPEGVTFELAIPLDGASPLRAAAGQRFGVRIQVYRNGAGVACLPGCAGGPLPADFRNLVLASGGCNSGVRNLDGGLPLDWTPRRVPAAPNGWRATGPSGDPVFCDEPAQGAGGSAACVSNFEYGGTFFADAYLDLPLPVTGQEWVTLSFLGTLVQGDPGDNFGLITWNATVGITDNPLTWQANHGPEIASATLDLTQGTHFNFPPNRISFYQATIVAGIEGGYAQADVVELRCGPVLFADGFESGLTTHWRATLP